MLSKLQKLREEREQGFTLIELLVVILIIGILAAIAIPAFLNQRKSAVDSSVQSDVTNAAKSVETAAIKVGAGNIVFGAPTTKSGDVVTLPGTGLPAGTTITAQTSEGTELKITGNTRDGYVITGTNPGGDQAVTAKGGFTYDSKAGGLGNGTPPAPVVP